jgi:hypothetical protein
MSVPREGLRRGERFATADVRSALYARLSLPELPATDWYRPRHQPADRDRPRAAVGGRQQLVEAPPDDGSTRGSSDVQPVRWRCTPSTDTQDCGSSVAARSTSPSSVGQALEGVLWFFPRRRLPPQVRGTFRWQYVQRLARCRKSCAVVSATSPEALRGRWHCLASDSSRES